MPTTVVRTTRDLKESLSYLRGRFPNTSSLAVVLGSGLGDFANRLEKRITIPLEEVPYYPRLTVEGHRGTVTFGRLGKTDVLVFQGRIHYYEVGDLSKVLYPIHISHGLGIKKLIVTNAAGGINRQFEPGDLMTITDHINLTLENPHSWASRPANVRQNQREMYDKRFQRVLEEAAAAEGIFLQHGVYCGLKGPCYETAAEIEMIRRIGGDAVGMSTVNEVGLAVRLGMRVAGISCVTNLATGILDAKLSHAEVTEVAHRSKQSFADLLTGFIERL